MGILGYGASGLGIPDDKISVRTNGYLQLQNWIKKDIFHSVNRGS